MSQYLDTEELGRNTVFRFGTGKMKSFNRFQHPFFQLALEWLSHFPGPSVLGNSCHILPGTHPQPEVWGDFFDLKSILNLEYFSTNLNGLIYFNFWHLR